MAKLILPPSEALYPVPVALVSCGRTPAKANIIAIAWCGVVCSKPPLISISVRPSRHSHKLITESGDFVVNIPSSDLAKKVDLCGMKSGRDTDKFKACSFTAVPSSKVSSPLIAECPMNIECVLRQTLKLGAHDMFIGEVVAVHADEGVVGKGDRIDFRKAKPFVYNHGEYWDLKGCIGHYGFSNE